MEVIVVDPLVEFFEAIRSPITKDRYTRRLGQFFKFINVDGSDLNHQASVFAKKAKADTPWATYQINEYMRFHKGRAERKEISNLRLLAFGSPSNYSVNRTTLSSTGRRFSEGYLAEPITQTTEPRHVRKSSPS